ncbi:MAG: hypothetical protein KGL32_05255 [candidate division NC10 bacterium]|nr:hypothetical protein [candidate division NC10 bacterium]
MQDYLKAGSHRGGVIRYLLAFGALFVLTSVLAIRLYSQYLQMSRGQWATLHHDRHAHLLQSMVFALDLGSLDLIHFIRDLHRARTYPPLFSLLTAPILLIGGFDYHLAALVSLAGWVGTIILVFLLTRQLAPSHRNAVALLAGLFALGSPAHRTYATDIMLESLGTCLSLLVLYLYISRRDAAGPSRSFALLGCSLTALFLLKYNYWALTMLALLLWEAISRYREHIGRLQHHWSQKDLQALLSRELRHPVGLGLAGIIGVAVLLLLTGGWEFFWAGQRIKVKASLNLAYIFFVLLCMRAAVICWRNRFTLRSLVGNRGMQLIRYHLLPVTAWLLWPEKLKHLLQFLSPTNAYMTQRAGYWGWETLLFYPRAVATEYHDGLWTALAVFSLTLFAFACASRFTPHARLIFLSLGMSAILTTIHPNHQSRYLHTWIPLLWVAGTIGLASILHPFAGARLIGVTASSGILAALIAASAMRPVTFAFTGRGFTDARPEVATALDLSDYYLPRIRAAQHVSIFATVPIYNFASWSYLQRYPDRRGGLTVGLKKFGESAASNRIAFDEWLKETRSEAIVFIDIPPGSFFYYSHWPGEEQHQQYRELVQSQSLFCEQERLAFPQYGSTVSILVRGEQVTSELRCARET